MGSNDFIQESTLTDQSADLESLLAEECFTPLKRGEVREGTIVSIGSSEILIDLGSKTEGIVAGRELDRMSRDTVKSLSVGDEVLAYVVNPEDKNGNIILSLTRAQLEKDWREAEQLFESQEMFSSTVAGFNKGGLIVRVGKVRGFVPASQLATNRHIRSGQGEGTTPEDKWGHLTGEELQLKVIEIDRSRNRLILSERAAMREWRKTQKEKLLSELAEGEVREGQVISLADFGAFVDLGGADGLIHLSELSWKRVNDPREVLHVGEKVKVYVLNVDQERRRIGLSLKRLQPDPWTLVDENYAIDQLVEGQITKLAKFGAFACLKGDEEIEGLIHISELSEEHIGHPKEVVQEGQLVTLRIIRIDADQRRMGLSLKRVDQAQYADHDWQAELAASQPAEETDEETTAETTEAPVAEAAEAPAAEATADEETVAEAAEAPAAETTADEETVVEATEAPAAEATADEETVVEATEAPAAEATADEETVAETTEAPVVKAPEPDASAEMPQDETEAETHPEEPSSDDADEQPDEVTETTTETSTE